MESGRPETVGLCFRCRHARIVESRTSRYWLCDLSASDPSFPKYPRLPVIACDGHEPIETPREEG